ncbi:putative methyltransferase C9orf114 [Diabrotica virgifera virgifera]|uniref:Methyltransferase C9orf114 n=1 Tax=Diabrotica virgifera virgifera TaxID=50390 RepID=A0A6P7F1Y7_DIAVI|nr:putative methyltransferase C9orf114 [Diabrotica virgifera virgifera]
MVPTTAPVKKQSWSEVNKLKKEEKKKWKEQNLVKKLEKKKRKEAVDNKLKESNVTVGNISTLSIAVPGSILENAQSQELRTYLAGQIARAACIFQVDEIVVFDDYGDEASAKKSNLDSDAGNVTARHSCIQLGRILQYLECPQYLRKHFFPIHNDLKFCGLLNPLNAPHHLGPKEEFLFREGVVLNKPAKSGSFVNVGLLKEVHVDKLLTPGIRCTVRVLPSEQDSKKLKGVIVSPSTPRKETGVYWGYTVRIATSLSKVFSQCPYKEGYDVSVGTSDKGMSVDDFSCPAYKNLLVMFGGLQGIEAALENDQVLNIDDPKLLFDHYLNTLPEQGSKTIRTEEAILISLAALRPKLNPENKPVSIHKNDIDKNEEIEDMETKVEEKEEDPLSRFD